jgi:hypothetical protein
LELQQPTFGKAHRGVVTDNEVIYDADVYQAQGLPKCSGQKLIRLRRLCDSARMVMGEYHRCRIEGCVPVR